MMSLMRTIPALRGLMLLLSVPHVCALVQILVVAAPHLHSQPSMFPTPRSVDECTGTNTVHQMVFFKANALQGYPNVEGLIITHGSPRNHIWSFAAGLTKDSNHIENCPCASPYPGRPAPSAVGEDYFCESANTGCWEYQW